MAGWRAALGPRAEILIFDDEVAVGVEGEALLRRLRNLADRCRADCPARFRLGGDRFDGRQVKIETRGVAILL